jgi:hypothetical protein
MIITNNDYYFNNEKICRKMIHLISDMLALFLKNEEE